MEGSVARPSFVARAPMLETLRESELRAGLAHELGHFAGGDTRLSGIASYTLATFESAIRSGDRGAFRTGSGPGAVEFGFFVARAFGGLVVRLYAQRCAGGSSRRRW